MKKFLVPLLSYTAFATIVVFCLAFFLVPVEFVSAGSESAFKVANGLCAVFDYLPSIFFTAFLLACSIAFAGSESRAEYRFSNEIAGLFKKIVVASIAITFVVSMCSLAFLPYQNSRKKTMQAVPLLQAEYIMLTNQYLRIKQPNLALQYAKRALSLDPKNPELLSLMQKAEIAQKEQEVVQKAEREKSYAQTDFNADRETPEIFDEADMSVFEILSKANELYAKGDFFGAHYLATQAWNLSGKNDPNLQDAKNLAGRAWNKLQEAQMEEPTEGNLFYRRKLTGYTALLSKDFLNAYYVFHSLSQEDERKARDPDVVRYLKLSQENLLKSYFFIDETYDASRFEAANNVYFALRNMAGGYDIVLIRGVAEVEGTGGMVRYLRDLQIFSFNNSGALSYSMSTPYAKMLGFSTATMDERTRKMYQSAGAGKNVPYIMLCSVSRDSKNHKNEPRYKFTSAQNEGPQPRQIFWPMPYEDFSLIMLSSGGQGNLNPFSLNRMARKAPDYGYSSEVFSVASLNKIFYPFMILILLILTATIAWNYRLSDNTVFKFKWIAIVPALNVIFYFAELCVEYLISLLNFVFIALAGTYFALLAGVAVYVLLLIGASVVFMSRKSG